VSPIVRSLPLSLLATCSLCFTPPTLATMRFLLSITPRPPTSTLFPYTTLFRSWKRTKPSPQRRPRQEPADEHHACQSPVPHRARSEEHTSELQSRENLVCRLLLEKKKRTRATTTSPRLTRRSPVC